MKAVAIALMGLVVVLAAAAAEGRLQAPSPSHGDESAACLNAVMSNMMTCVDYMLVGSSDSKPDKACCSGTQAVLKADPNCLCLALAEAGSYGLEVNVTRAAALPSLCHISAPPTLSKCLAAAAKAKAPAPSTSAPARAPEAHRSHHEAAPAPAPKKGAASSASASFGLMAAVGVVVLAFSV